MFMLLVLSLNQRNLKYKKSFLSQKAFLCLYEGVEMSRKKSRDLCFKIVFSSLFAGLDKLEQSAVKMEDCFNLDDYLEENNLTKLDCEYGISLAEATLTHSGEILSILRDNITGYTLDRVYKPELAILMMSVCELRYFTDTNLKIVINEAVELTKTYGDEKGYKFVHGVLSKIVQGGKG